MRFSEFLSGVVQEAGVRALRDLCGENFLRIGATSAHPIEYGWGYIGQADGCLHHDSAGDSTHPHNQRYLHNLAVEGSFVTLDAMFKELISMIRRHDDRCLIRNPELLDNGE